MSDTAVVPPDVLTAVRTKHRALWALGDYPAVATEVIPALGPILVDAAGVRPGGGGGGGAGTSRRAPATPPSPPRSPART
jgi:hypothetical protein